MFIYEHAGWCGQMNDDSRHGYAIASRYNVILVCLSLKQNITIFPLRSTPPNEVHLHRIICIGHVYGSHFV